MVSRGDQRRKGAIAVRIRNRSDLEEEGGRVGLLEKWHFSMYDCGELLRKAHTPMQVQGAVGWSVCMV